MGGARALAQAAQPRRLGRGALANPLLSAEIARELGIGRCEDPPETNSDIDWIPHLRRLVFWTQLLEGKAPNQTVRRLKQWLNIARLQGSFSAFETIKRAQSIDELFTLLAG